MTVSYHLEPTARLSGLHMAGTVARRFLISYPVPPETLTKCLRPDAEVSLHDGAAGVELIELTVKGYPGESEGAGSIQCVWQDEDGPLKTEPHPHPLC